MSCCIGWRVDGIFCFSLFRSGMVLAFHFCPLAQAKKVRHESFFRFQFLGNATIAVELCEFLSSCRSIPLASHYSYRLLNCHSSLQNTSGVIQSVCVLRPFKGRTIPTTDITITFSRMWRMERNDAILLLGRWQFRFSTLLNTRVSG